MFFCGLLDESLMHSWSNFGRPATSGKIHLYSKFSLFVDNVSHCGSQSLRNIFVTQSRLIDTISLDCGMMCSLLHLVIQVLFEPFLDSGSNRGLITAAGGCQNDTIFPD